MRDEMSDIRYRIGDMMGSYAPDSFRRSNSTMEWMIGLGSVVAAAGISYIAMRMADRRLKDVIRSIAPHYVKSNGRERPMVHGTRGAEMPATDGRETRSRTERPAMRSTEGGRMPGERSQERS